MSRRKKVKTAEELKKRKVLLLEKLRRLLLLANTVTDKDVITGIDKNFFNNTYKSKANFKRKNKEIAIFEHTYGKAPIIGRYFKFPLAKDYDSKYVKKNKNRFIFLNFFNNVDWIFNLFFLTFLIKPDFFRKSLFSDFYFLRSFLLLRFNVYFFNFNILLADSLVTNDDSDVLVNFRAFCHYEMSLYETVDGINALIFFNHKKDYFILFNFYVLYIDMLSFFLMQQAFEFVKAITYNEYIGTNLFFFPELRTSLIKNFNEQMPPWRSLTSSRYVLHSFMMSLFYNNVVLLTFSTNLQKYKGLKELFVYITISSPLLQILQPATISGLQHYDVGTLLHMATFSMMLHILHVFQTGPKKFTVAKSLFRSFEEIFSRLIGFERDSVLLFGAYINLWETKFFDFVFSENFVENFYFLSSFNYKLKQTFRDWSLFDLLYDRFTFFSLIYYNDRGFSNVLNLYEVKNFLKKDKKKPFINESLLNNSYAFIKDPDYFNYDFEEDTDNNINRIKDNKLLYLRNKIKVFRQGLKNIKLSIREINEEANFIKLDETFSFKRNRMASLKNQRLKTLNDKKFNLKKIIKSLEIQINVFYEKIEKFLDLPYYVKEHYLRKIENDDQLALEYNKSLYTKLISTYTLNFEMRTFLAYKLGTDIQSDEDVKKTLFKYVDFSWYNFGFLTHIFDWPGFRKVNIFIKAKSFDWAEGPAGFFMAEDNDFDYYIPLAQFFNWKVLNIDDLYNFFHFNINFISCFDLILMDSFFINRFINLKETFDLYFETISPTIRRNMPVSIFSYFYFKEICLKIFMSSNIFALFFLFLETAWADKNEVDNVYITNVNNDLGHIKFFLANFYFFRHIELDVENRAKNAPGLPYNISYK
jgi:hypothetical protein